MLGGRDLPDAINARAVEDGIYIGSHDWTDSARLERGVNNIFKNNDGTISNRFVRSEIEAYRWIAAQGLIKTEGKSSATAGSRIDDDLFNAMDGIVNDPLSSSNLNLLDKAFRESPSNFNGKQHPLHLWQTSDYLAVPNMNELQRITKRNAILMATQGNSLLNYQATNLVSWWSFLTLLAHVTQCATVLKTMFYML